MGTHEKSIKKIPLSRKLVYVGERKNGYRHGNGEYTYQEGSYKYNGDWVEGKKHGKGTFTMKDAFTYSGDFIDGEITGKGTKIWNDGREYSGSFMYGHMEGDGILKNKLTGEICEGTWKRNMLEGKGKRIYANSSIYEGYFSSHKPHGIGVFTTSTGEIYEGEFVNGKKEGKGKNIWDNGDEYQGDWIEDKREGIGKFIEKLTGIFVAGKWIDDDPEKSSKEFDFLTPNNDLSIENSTPFPLIQVGIKAENKERVTEESGRPICLTIQYSQKAPPPSAKDPKKKIVQSVSSKKLQQSKSTEEVSVSPLPLLNISFQTKTETETITTDKLRGKIVNGRCDFNIIIPHSAENGEYNLIIEDETPETSSFGRLLPARLTFHLVPPVKQVPPTKRTTK